MMIVQDQDALMDMSQLLVTFSTFRSCYISLQAARLREPRETARLAQESGPNLWYGCTGATQCGCVLAQRPYPATTPPTSRARDSPLVFAWVRRTLS
jgi:hypothetical protein